MNLRRLAVPLLALGALLVAPAARADFATTNVQLLQGWNFHDKILHYDTNSGAMTTVTINHFSTWSYGDNFFFVDLYQGNFNDPDAYYNKAKAYGEWHPRLDFTKMFGFKMPGFKTFGPAAELNLGSGYYGYLAGVGGDLDLPIPGVVGINFYYKYDQYLKNTYQISPYWTVPFNMGPLPFLFTGFIDVQGWKTDGNPNDANNGFDGLDFLGQPELLVDVLAPFGGRAGKLYAGCEYYLHFNKTNNTQSPQAMLQWNFD